MDSEEKNEATLPLMTTKEDVLACAQELAQKEEDCDKQHLDLLKQLYYKFSKAEQLAARDAFVEAGGNPEDYQPTLDPCEEPFREAINTIRQRRAEQLAEQDRQKAENLEKKLVIIERIKDMIATPEDANRSYDDFKSLQAQWKEIGPVPAEKTAETWKNYQLYVEQFYDLLKLNHEMREYDFRKNLEIKTRLCEQAEKLAEVEDVISAFNQLQGLHQEYKETGPVAKELRDEIWNRFKAASTVVNKRHQDHFLAQKEREEENLARKTALCEQLEAIDTQALKSFSDWDAKSQEVIEVQNTWKTIGYAPQKMNQKIFERFRAACDHFFNEKANFFKTLKDGQQQNLSLKQALVEKAEALMNSEEWKETTDLMVEMQKEWKTIGAVPKKFSDALWKRFNDACDTFFEKKKQATSGQRNEEQANLAKKQEITAQLNALLENPEEGDLLQKVRDLQKQWGEVGHVPFREKDKAYKQYREACDKLYDLIGKNREKRRMESFQNRVKASQEEGNDMSGERNRMMRAYENMKAEIQTYENNLGFLSAGNKKGNALIDEMRNKVEKMKEELALLAKKIKMLS